MRRMLTLPLLAALVLGMLPLATQAALAQPGPGFDRDHRPPPPPRHYHHHRYHRHLPPPR
ncbi:hypothetical protein [Lichenicoccus sp.]|uniref:hypothetical protein n=1 Tax=Lichenicoccus sp. TaxID=2781899 RepID=UPI003D0D5819